MTVTIARKAGGDNKVEFNLDNGATYYTSGQDLTFTSGNWDSTQTVYVRSVADGDDDDEADVLTHSISSVDDSDYNGLAAVELTVNVLETRNIVLNPATALSLTEGGAASSYTVKLSHQPTATVTVAVASANADLEFSTDGGTIYAATQSLSFTGGGGGNWDTEQTVHVRATADDDGDDETTTITHTPSGGGYSVVGSRAVNIADADTRGLVISSSPLNMAEGDDTYTVKLATQPRGDVTVTIARKAGGDNKVEFNTDGGATYYTSGQDLTFTSGNWDSTQTVYVRSVADGDDDDEADVLTHSISSVDDSDYNGLAAVELTVNVLETRNIVLNPATALSLTEGGAASSYTVKLSHQPTATVTVAVASANSDLEFSTDGGTIYAATRSLSFTGGGGGNWDTEQTVHVRATADDDGDDETTTITHTPSDGGYSVVGSRAVNIADADDRGLVISPSPLNMAEGDDTYTVKLATQPRGDVTVTIARKAGGDNKVEFNTDGGATYYTSGQDLTFTSGNWDSTQTVSVRSVADGDDDDEADVLTHSISSVDDSDYNGLAAVELTVNVLETRNIVLNPATALSLTEGGAASSYTVKLSHQPTATVTVAVASANSDLEFSIDGGTIYAATRSLSFTGGGGNWDTEQTVHVRATADDDGDDETTTITHTPSDGGYSVVGSRAVNIADADDRGLVISPSPLNMAEGDDTYTVKLATQPRGDVTVTIARKATGGDNKVEFNTDGGATYYTSGQTLTFTAGNWDSTQTVYVRSVADGDDDDEADVLTHSISSVDDSDYNGLAAVELTVNVLETRNIVLNPATALSLTEGGAASSYTVKLSHQPTATVTVAVASANSDLEFSTDGGTIYAATRSLSFTGGGGGNWDTEQTVHVRATADDDGDDETTTITHTPSDGGYSVVGSRAVNIADADTRGLVISPSPLNMAEGDATCHYLHGQAGH